MADGRGRRGNLSAEDMLAALPEMNKPDALEEFHLKQAIAESMRAVDAHPPSSPHSESSNYSSLSSISMPLSDPGSKAPSEEDPEFVRAIELAIKASLDPNIPPHSEVFNCSSLSTTKIQVAPTAPPGLEHAPNNYNSTQLLFYHDWGESSFIPSRAIEPYGPQFYQFETPATTSSPTTFPATLGDHQCQRSTDLPTSFFMPAEKELEENPDASWYREWRNGAAYIATGGMRGKRKVYIPVNVPPEEFEEYGQYLTCNEARNDRAQSVEKLLTPGKMMRWCEDVEAQEALAEEDKLRTRPRDKKRRCDGQES